MAKTRSMTRKKDHESSSSNKKKIKTFDNDDVSPWWNVNRDVLLLVIMQLGIVDFLSFSMVCKSWRAFALSVWNMFMVSRPPMPISINPYSGGRPCIGLTCGYLIFCGRETRDFWLVNLITRHELHFPNFPRDIGDCEIKAILVFSPSISGWVFVVLHKKASSRATGKRKISFCIAGKRRWNYVSSGTPPVIDLHVFKGKIYTLHTDFSLSELGLNPKRKYKWTLLKTKNFPNPDFSHPRLISSSENLFMIDRFSRVKKVMELDFGEMKWVSQEKSIREYAFFISPLYSSAAIKPKSWAGPPTQYQSYDYFLDTDETRGYMFYHELMWYFPHDCLNVNLLDE